MILLTTAVALAGALIAKKLRLPAALMTGAMVAVVLYNVFTQAGSFPLALKPIVQIVAGGFIGLSVTRDNFRELRTMVRPVTVYFLLLVVICTSAGLLTRFVSPQVDLPTGLLACAPGGIMDMTLLSYDYNANTAQITTLQMLRLLLGFSIFPSISQKYVAYLRRTGKIDAALVADPDEAAVKGSGTGSGRDFLLTALVAVAGGAAGHLSGFPAGALTFSMVAVAVYNVRWARAYMPDWIRKVAQILSGALVGVTITRADILNLRYLVVPFFIVAVQYTFICYGIGPFIARRYHIGVDTMLLACSPAGVTDMALIAQDMGGDVSKVAVFQIVRLCGTLAVFPVLVKLFVALLGH